MEIGITAETAAREGIATSEGIIPIAEVAAIVATLAEGDRRHKQREP